MRTIRAATMAVLLALGSALPVTAVGPEIFRESGASSGIDDTWSAACDATIVTDLTFRATYITWAERWEVHWQALRTIQGPGGILLVRNNYSFGGPNGTVVEDEAAGTVTEHGQTTTTGARVLVDPATGVVLRDTGLYFEDVTAVYGPGDEFSLTINESYSRGSNNEMTEDAFNALVCAVLVS